MKSVFAAINNPAVGFDTTDPTTGAAMFSNLISTAISSMIIIAGIICLVYLIWGGIGWMTAGGDKNNLEAARNRIINAVVGLIIVGAAWAIWIFIGSIFGLDFPNLTLPTLTGA